jgi:hypothetical protein
MLPTYEEMFELVSDVQGDICDDFLAFEDDDEPGIQLTVGLSPDGSWDYQTGDNSYTGGAYGHPVWAVVGVYRESDPSAVAADILDQLAEEEGSLEQLAEWSEQSCE